MYISYTIMAKKQFQIPYQVPSVTTNIVKLWAFIILLSIFIIYVGIILVYNDRYRHSSAGRKNIYEYPSIVTNKNIDDLQNDVIETNPMSSSPTPSESDSIQINLFEPSVERTPSPEPKLKVILRPKTDNALIELNQYIFYHRAFPLTKSYKFWQICANFVYFDWYTMKGNSFFQSQKLIQLYTQQNLRDVLIELLQPYCEGNNADYNTINCDNKKINTLMALIGMIPMNSKCISEQKRRSNTKKKIYSKLGYIAVSELPIGSLPGNLIVKPQITFRDICKKYLNLSIQNQSRIQYLNDNKWIKLFTEIQKYSNDGQIITFYDETTRQYKENNQILQYWAEFERYYCHATIQNNYDIMIQYIDIDKMDAN